MLIHLDVSNTAAQLLICHSWQDSDLGQILLHKYLYSIQHKTPSLITIHEHIWHTIHKYQNVETVGNSQIWDRSCSTITCIVYNIKPLHCTVHMYICTIVSYIYWIFRGNICELLMIEIWRLSVQWSISRIGSITNELIGAAQIWILGPGDCYEWISISTPRESFIPGEFHQQMRSHYQMNVLG